jgi:division protein CdvB (Snf7/Vps24/ESCRT-III family)
LVRTRRYVKKFMLMRANIQAVSLKIQTLKSQNAMAQAMKGVTKAMGSMNKQMKLPEIQKIMMEFEKQSEIMDMKEEMMADTIGKNSWILYYVLLEFYKSRAVLRHSLLPHFLSVLFGSEIS